MKFNWSYRIFNQEKKKLNMNIPNEHVISKDTVIKSLKENVNSDYIFWIGHATFLIKLGNTTIITDPVFEKNMGPLICLLYTSPSPRDATLSRMPSSA